ncbi:MAG: isoleucine--tRNA ligase [Gemmataceae bacterium]|nr:isoleucine--tRNA ligase [Gemmataceae bacterium]
MFEKVETQADFPALEREALAFWNRTGAFDKLRQKNQAGQPWSFLDGPITANNPMGVHHAWGRTFKDAFQRYHAMLGKKQRWQNGFDCQGLWVEVEVEKELGLKSKRDIENLVPGDPFAGIDRFVSLCKERVNTFARKQTEQSIRLGYWMDWDQEEDWSKPAGERRSYYTMSDENNYTIWSFLKKCHTRGLVSRGYDAMPWCPRCSVGLSQMEMAEGYQMVAHRSVFVRFPLRDKPGSFLLIWTTTPWTLTSNVAAAVNPANTYLEIQHKEQRYFLAKGAFTHARLEEEFKRKEWVEGTPKLKTLEQLFKEKGGYEIVRELKGEELVGLAYDGPFDELPAQGHPHGYPRAIAEVVEKRGWSKKVSARESHRVLAWKDVGESEGTGIVHIAPGCGKEDFHLGVESGIPPVAPLDEFGCFLPGFGPLEGKCAVDADTASAVIDNLQSKGLLFAVEKYPHKYPHCWRCKTELLFRLVDEWFISMSWRDEIMKIVEEVTFLPASVNGKARELDWLKNMGDWMISKKRYWGLALPIWVCGKCGQFEVIGSKEELRARASEGWDKFEGKSPHRPWIDCVKIRCQCGGVSARVPDVGNPWLDAGIVPYSTMGFNRDRAEWEKWFPADFITECFPGQFRNWFYAILAMSAMMTGRAPFKTLLGHALVRDQNGDEMHKSKGNSIPFEGAANDGYEIRNAKGELEKHPAMGADLIRWMFCRTNPAANINFGPGPADDLRARFILKLWNTYAFFCNYARLDRFDPCAPAIPVKERPDIDRWILSDLQKLVAMARESFESYDLASFCLEAERFIDDKLSNWYVRRNRRRFWKSEQGKDKTAAYQTLHQVLLTFTKLIAPVAPFLAETLYHNLVDAGDDSVHLQPYPAPDASLADEELSADMEALLKLVTLGSSARNAVKIKVRQPLACLRVQPGDEAARRAVVRFSTQLCEELNLKKVELWQEAGSLLRPEIKPNPKTLGPKFGQKIREVQTAIAAADPMLLWQKTQGSGKITLESASGPFELEGADLFITLKGEEGWAGVADKNTQVALDIRITADLAAEGLARDIIRQVQEQRKKAGLEMEDRIALSLETTGEALQKAIAAHRDYIGAETLVQSWGAPGNATSITVKIEGQDLHITLGKI